MRRRRTHRRRVTRAVLALMVLVASTVAAAHALGVAARDAAGVELVQVRVDDTARGRATTRTVRLPIRADMLGATWTGSEEIELRARTTNGAWSRWVHLERGEDGPDPRSVEGRRARTRLKDRRAASAPVWVGAADQVQVRGHDGRPVRSVRIWAVNATGTATARERLVTRAREDAAWVLGEPALAQPLAPGIRSRATWQAAKPAAAPWYADVVRGVVIHHTAGTNRYSCSQVPAVLRGIQRYHMGANGWNDIGYNFLVDRCGGVWEGRAGGVRNPVGGAHTSGFNTNTTGIALVGTHAGVSPSRAAQDALRRLVAWRLDVAHVKPTGQMVLTAASSDKFAAGSRVVVRAVSGHRDLFPTSCPGALEYATLTRLARDAWATGGAKVANITSSVVRRAPNDPLDATVASIALRAVASHADMDVTLRLERISSGERLHEQVIRGTLAETTWTAPASLSVPTWDIRIVVEGVRSTGQRARPALVPLEPVAADPGFVVTAPPPPTVTVGGDPADDAIRLQYTLASDYRVGAWLHDATTGEELAVLREPAYVGPTATPIELVIDVPDDVPAGTYELRVGLPADPAAGRSMRRFAITIARS